MITRYDSQVSVMLTPYIIQLYEAQIAQHIGGKTTKNIAVSFFSFIYETEHHNGIAELLEILGR